MLAASSSDHLLKITFASACAGASIFSTGTKEPSKISCGIVRIGAIAIAWSEFCAVLLTSRPMASPPRAVRKARRTRIGRTSEPGPGKST